MRDAAMGDGEVLAQRFEEHRAHVRAGAFRLLGSTTEADDAIQEAWLRISRAGADGVENPGGWLMTVVSRVCLNMLEARGTGGSDPEHDAQSMLYARRETLSGQADLRGEHVPRRLRRGREWQHRLDDARRGGHRVDQRD